ncbi:MAG: Trp biosynthesis-associated membrane protein [Micromonosporaceae bacterium]
MPAHGQMPSQKDRRSLMLAIVAGAAGAGLVLLAAQQRWARVSFAPPPPLPASTVVVTGQDLVPAAGALGLAALACLAAILATRGLARRAVGVALAVLGAVAGLAAAGSAGTAHVAATAAARSMGPRGVPRIAMDTFPWWVVAMAGGAVIVAVGLAAAWRGTRWPGMSSRYERAVVDETGPATSRPGDQAPGDQAPGQARDPARDPAGDPATVWAALDRGADPTVTGERA